MATTTSYPGVAPSLVANPDLCTLSTCPLALAQLTYLPNLGGNALFIAIFALGLALQVFLGIRYRTWGFMAGMIGGTLLECIGYAGRLQMHSNPFPQGPFLMYLIPLTIGPAFLSASIYLCLARIVVAYGEEISRFRPRTYTITFVTFDFIALLLQAIGGAIASIANTQNTRQLGVDIMVAGVSWQVFSLAAFVAMCADFAWRVRKTKQSLNPLFAQTRASKPFRYFLWTLFFATLFVFIRSVFRIVELSGGFNGALANNQISFMVLEGTMISLAVILLTVLHPGIAFQHQFAQAGWNLRKKKNGGMQEAKDSEDSELAIISTNENKPALV